MHAHDRVHRHDLSNKSRFAIVEAFGGDASKGGLGITVEYNWFQ